MTAIIDRTTESAATETAVPNGAAVKCGMIGIGGFGRSRRERLRRSGAFRIVAGIDPDAAAFRAAEQEEGRPIRRHAEVGQLLADDEVEAVFVSAPAHLHLDFGWKIARAGKALFMEKPLGHDVAACRKLVRYCEEKAVPHGHGFSEPFFPLWRKVAEILKNGGLGRVLSVSAASMHTGGLAAPVDNWRFTRENNPGGPLFQCGIHKIDLLRRFFGEGRWLAGTVNRRITSTDTDDACVLLGQFGDVPVTLHSHYVASFRHAMEIYGTKGNLVAEQFPTRLRLQQTDLGAGREWTEDLTGSLDDTDAESESLRDFARAIRERRQPLMNGRDGLEALELVVQAAAIVRQTPFGKS